MHGDALELDAERCQRRPTTSISGFWRSTCSVHALSLPLLQERSDALHWGMIHASVSRMDGCAASAFGQPSTITTAPAVMKCAADYGRRGEFFAEQQPREDHHERHAELVQRSDA